VNTGRMLPSAWGAGKYDVSRQLAAGPTAAPVIEQVPLLSAA